MSSSYEIDSKQEDIMKKLSMFVLIVMLIASLFISCDNSVKSMEDGLVEVRIGTGSGSRGLNSTVDLDDETGLEWHYSAHKVTERQFKFGETLDSALSEDGVVTFSQGIWDFGLWALKDGKRVYSGTVTGVLITKTSDGSPTPVVVPVSPYTGVNGTIKLKGITIHAKTDGETPVLVTPNYAKIDNAEIAGFNGTADAIEVATGSHSVTVAYKGTDGVTYASETIYVTVYSGRETLVTGFVSEETGSADISHKSTVAIVGIDGGVKSGVASTVSVGVTPSMEKGTEENPIQTTVKFPEDSFSNTEVADAVLTVNVKPIDSTFSASAAGSDTAVAGLDIALLVNDQPVTQFNDKSVTIETYIAKGLENVKVYYDGSVIAKDDDTTDIYDSGNGKLTFTTSHFSEFYVGSSSVEAINVDTNTAFETLKGAIDSASAGNTIKLLKEVGLETSLIINDGKVLTIDLNGFDIHAKSKTILISNANVTFAGSGIIYESVDDQLGALIVKGSDTDVSNYTVVTVEKGVTLRGWSGIIIATDVAGGYNNYGIVINLYGNVIVPGMDIEHNVHTTPGNGLYINGTNINTTGNVPVFNINGANISSTGLGIYAAGYAKWNISGDTKITGNDSAIEIRAGELSITGGTFEATSTPSGSTSNGSGSTTEGAAIAVAQHTTKLPINVNISGGTFEGYSAFYQSNPENNSADDIAKVNLSITGGIFNAINGGTCAIYSQNKEGFISGGKFNVLPYKRFIETGKTTIKGESLYRVVDFTTEDESKRGVTISGIAGVADFYDTIQYAYEDVKAMLVRNSGLAEQPLSVEAFNAFFTDGGTITWTIYDKQKVTDTRMFSFGRAANRFGTGLHITEINIVGGNSSASLDLSAVDGTFALPYNWWNVADSVNTTLKCSNITFDGIKYMPSATYQCTLYPTTYEFDHCTFNGDLYSYQNFDVEMTIKNCKFNAPDNKTKYAFMSQGLGGTITLDNNVFNNYTRGINLQRPTADFNVTNNTIVSTVSESDRGAIQLTDGKSFVVTGNTVDINAGNAFWFHNAATNADVTYTISNNNIKAPYIGYSGVTAFDVNTKITSSGNTFNITYPGMCMKKDQTVAEATNLTAIR